MLHRIETLFMKLRRFLSRSSWLTAILRLCKAPATETTRALIMIQIDALSRKQFEKALAAGKMPFLAELLANQRYKLISHYPGMPCMTPAVQCELFYGKKSFIPAFHFYKRNEEQTYLMFRPEAARRIQEDAQQDTRALLEQGSSYCNIFSGGANETHFCISQLGFGLPFKRCFPFGLFITFLLHFYSLIRVVVLIVLELCLAIIDFFRGLIQRQDIIKEFKLVFSRVGLCVLMREMITISATTDIRRGLPIIHLNYIGYHEQSHRRGASSAFAHWTLKGIDDAIKRVYTAANRSPHRDYDVWVYSDHGQTNSVPYQKVKDETIQKAVARIFDRSAILHPDHSKAPSFKERCGLGGLNSFLHVTRRPALNPTTNHPITTAQGPLGHVYIPQDMGEIDKATFAERLFEEAGVPTVLYVDHEGKVHARTPNGLFLLPEEANKVLDASKPWFEEMKRDLVTACHHKDAGDFIIIGWHGEGKPYYTFVPENGSHGGIGNEETEGFVLLPGDTPLPSPPPVYLRATGLRDIAFEFLKTGVPTNATTVRNISAPSASPVADASEIRMGELRIMTYNVHSCIGIDGRLSIDRVSRTIAQFEPDMVALQELDVGRNRTLNRDQAMEIATQLSMMHHFHPAMQVEEELYGDAILSSIPMQLVKAAHLPRLSETSSQEPRGAIWVELTTARGPLQMINTHLGLSFRERKLQMQALLSEDWLGKINADQPVVLCGDFNTFPNSRIFHDCKNRFDDVHKKANCKRRNTWFGRFPIVQVDHIFVSDQITVNGTLTADSHLARVASDHRPLLATITLPTSDAPDQSSSDA